MALKKSIKKSSSVVAKKIIAKPAIAQNLPLKKASLPFVSAMGLSRKKAGIALIIIVLIVLLVVFRNQFVVATVNGQPISRFALIGELERQAGKTTLDVLITKTLIKQEAEKRNISVSDKELNDEAKKIEDSLKEQGQDLDTLLAGQGMSRSEFMGQIKIQVLVKKMLIDETKVTDKEIDDYLEKNKASMPEDMEEGKLKGEVKTQLEQQKLSETSNKLVTELREKAKINRYLNLE
ncbi:MAG: SurA N-terminal domain-containing protein [Candidatus Levyibacteriota bacterium]